MEDHNLPKTLLDTLPPEVLLQIAAYLPWHSRLSASLTNFRLYTILHPTLLKAHRLSIKGNESVDFYLLDLQLDQQTTVRHELKKMGAKTTEIKTVWSTVDVLGGWQKKRKVEKLAKQKVAEIFRRVLRHFKLDKIEIGIDSFIDFLSEYSGKINTLGISNCENGIQQAIRLKPKKLTIFEKSSILRNEKCQENIDLEKFPQLESLHLYTSSINLDQFLSSKIHTLIASTRQSIEISPAHIQSIIKQYKKGREIRKIQIFSNNSTSNWTPFSAYYYYDYCNGEMWKNVPGMIGERIENLEKKEQAIMMMWNQEFCFYTCPCL